MSGFFDQQQIEIPCPGCKTKFKKSIRDLKRPGVRCPKCGVAFETSQFKSGLEKAERSIQDLQKTLRDIKINIKL